MLVSKPAEFATESIITRGPVAAKIAATSPLVILL